MNMNILFLNLKWVCPSYFCINRTYLLDLPWDLVVEGCILSKCPPIFFRHGLKCLFVSGIENIVKEWTTCKGSGRAGPQSDWPIKWNECQNNHQYLWEGLTLFNLGNFIDGIVEVVTMNAVTVAYGNRWHAQMGGIFCGYFCQWLVFKILVECLPNVKWCQHQPSGEKNEPEDARLFIIRI